MKRKSPDTEISINARKRIKQIIDEKCNGRQVEFVERTGIPKGTVSHYVNGGNIPSDKSANIIAKAFGVSPLWVKGYDVSVISDEPQRFNILRDAADEMRTHNEIIFENVFDAAGYILEQSDYQGEYAVLRFNGRSKESISISSEELCKFNESVEQYAGFLISKMFSEHRVRVEDRGTILAAAHKNANPDAGDSDFPENDIEMVEKEEK